MVKSDIGLPGMECRMVRRGLILCFAAIAFTLIVGGAKAEECQQAGDADAIAEGRLSERGDALILKLPTPMCLKGSEPTDNVASSTELHVFSLDEDVDGALRSMVGKDVHLRGSFAGATTKFHKAPIVMQVDEADEI
jgi:hypothetical protein